MCVCVRARVCACVCGVPVCVCVRVRECVCACVARVCAHTDTCARTRTHKDTYTHARAGAHPRGGSILSPSRATRWHEPTADGVSTPMKSNAATTCNVLQSVEITMLLNITWTLASPARSSRMWRDAGDA